LVDRLKNDHEFREFHEPTDKELIDQENSEYFNKTYGITSIHPLLVDHSGSVLLFLDNRGIMFAWCEMDRVGQRDAILSLARTVDSLGAM